MLRQSSKTATKIDINQDAKIFLHQLPTPIYRGGGKGGLLHYDFFTLADIHAALSRLSVKLPPVERVPRGSPHPCRGGAGGGVSIYLTDAGRFVAEVEVEGRQGASTCAILANLEVRTAGTDAGAALRIVQCVVFAEEQDAHAIEAHAVNIDAKIVFFPEMALPE